MREGEGWREGEREGIERGGEGEGSEDTCYSSGRVRG